MKRRFWVLVAAGVVWTLSAEMPKPYIHWRMDGIADGVIANVGTNTDARCDLTVGAGVCITNVQGLGQALYFDAVNAPTAAWASSWGPGVRSRTLSFWLYRPGTDEGIDVNVNKAHYIITGQSYLTAMCGPGASGVINIKVGVNESTAEQIAHTYFYNALTAARGSWHHMAFVLVDSGRVEESEANYLGCPIYELKTYLDGVLQKSVTKTLELDPLRAGAFVVGNTGAGGVRPLPGALSDVRFYDTPLSDAEIHELFQARLPELRGELLAWYPLDRIETADGLATTPEMSGRDLGAAMRLGGAVTTVTGPVDTALQFDATAASWASTTITPRGLPILDYTIAFWMHVPRDFDRLCGELSRHMARIYVWGASRFMFNSTDEYADASTKADLFLLNDATKFTPQQAYLEKGSWVHVAIAVETACDYSSGSAAYSVKPTFYADGVRAYEGNWTATDGNPRLAASSVLTLANNAQNGERGLYGAMADFRLYRGALTSNEVAAVCQGAVQPDAGEDFSVARDWAELRGWLASRATEGCYGRAPIAQLAWRLVSAPEGGEGAVIETPASQTTRVTLPVTGTYVFRLTATAMGAARSAEVQVTRLSEPRANEAPTVSTAASLEASVGMATPLAATMADGDSGPGGLRGRWRMVSGAGGVWFDDARNAATTAVFSQPGRYTLRFSADDGWAVGSADVAVTVSGTAADPARTLSEGLMGYWPIRYGAMKDVITGTAVARDLAHTRLDAGVDGHGFRGYGKATALETGLTPQETGTAGNRPRPESAAGTFRAFSFWMYHDAANPGTNATKSICLISQPYSLGLWYTPENGVSGNTQLFQVYQQSMNKDEDGNTITGGGGTLFYPCPANPPVNRWVHVYVAFDRYNPIGANRSELWIDGVRQTPSGGSLGFSRINAAQMTFAGMAGSRVTDSTQNGYYRDTDGNVLSRTLPGWMDEIRMYNRMLSEAEIVYLATHPVVDENRGPSVGMPNAAETACVAHKKPMALAATAAGDPMPSQAELAYEWRVVRGVAADVVFADPSARTTTATFARAGSYAVQLAVSDGVRTTYSDPLVVEVPVAGLTINFR